MSRSAIEARTVRLTEHVLDGGSIEDDHVEAKGPYPGDDGKTARRLAACLNVARGEPVLWIIGLDEAAHQLVDPGTDPANWWPGVAAKFDGQPPELTHLVVPIRDVGAVTALQFDSRRPPYVVKNWSDKGPEREVPWRAATGVRSAYRSELVGLLADAGRRPEFEWEHLSITIHAHEKGGGEQWHWRAEVGLLVIPREPVSILFGRTTMVLTIRDGPPMKADDVYTFDWGEQPSKGGVFHLDHPAVLGLGAQGTVRDESQIGDNVDRAELTIYMHAPGTGDLAATGHAWWRTPVSKNIRGSWELARP